jgi:hypothetical protein
MERVALEEKLREAVRHDGQYPILLWFKNKKHRKVALAFEWTLLSGELEATIDIDAVLRIKPEDIEHIMPFKLNALAGALNHLLGKSGADGPNLDPGCFEQALDARE